ncbi:MAG TPA: hypothetical protein VMW83_08980 [Spirochaetia bacterium]|nr:hypothetical protein [Spirochaetia bacterium]
MQDLFTYASLGTMAGAVAATVLVIDFIKDLGPLKRIPTRVLVLVVAEGVVLLAGVAAGDFTLKNVPLSVLNGLLVAASAMGSWQTVKDRFGGGSGKAKGG